MNLVDKLQLELKLNLKNAPSENVLIPIDLKFPLSDHTYCFKGKPRYAKDHLITGHNADFMNEALFVEACEVAGKTASLVPEWGESALCWNTYVCCWAASHAKNLPGDFVECGVHTGLLSRAVIHYINFPSTGKKFYLADTFCGIPEDQTTEDERSFFDHIGLDLINHHNKKYYFRDYYEDVKETFKDFNVEIVRGRIPDTLSLIDAEEICYLSIDMNTATPEIEAAEYLWDKLVPGAIVILDDYGWDLHIMQKFAFDGFAKNKSVPILPLPTGQGLIIKP